MVVTWNPLANYNGYVVYIWWNNNSMENITVQSTNYKLDNGYIYVAVSVAEYGVLNATKCEIHPTIPQSRFLHNTVCITCMLLIIINYLVPQLFLGSYK